MNLCELFEQDIKLKDLCHKINEDQKQFVSEFIAKQSSSILRYFKLFKLPNITDFVNIPPFDFLLLIKILKPNEIENYAKSFFYQQFNDQLARISSNNLDHILKLQLNDNYPFVILSDVNHKKHFFNELEKLKIRNNKATSAQISPAIRHIILSDLNFRVSYNIIKQGIAKGEWLFIDNIQYLQASYITLLLKLIMEFVSARHVPLRCFFQVECECAEYGRLDFMDQGRDFVEQGRDFMEQGRDFNGSEAGGQLQ